MLLLLYLIKRKSTLYYYSKEKPPCIELFFMDIYRETRITIHSAAAPRKKAVFPLSRVQKTCQNAKFMLQ